MQCPCGKFLSDHTRLTDKCTLPSLALFGRGGAQDEGQQLPSSESALQESWRRMIAQKPKPEPPVSAQVTDEESPFPEHFLK